MIYYICYLLTLSAPIKIRELIAMDITAFNNHIKRKEHLQEYKTKPEDKILKRVELMWLLKNIKEFRNVWFWRMGATLSKLHCVTILNFFMPPMKNLFFSSPASLCGGGVYVEHGYSTVIRCERFGEWFSVNQNVTIGGNSKGGIPKIGNNVSVFTGAVVIGDINIGDNVKIGANATIVKNIPSNCTVVPSQSIIVKKDGYKLKEVL